MRDEALAVFDRGGMPSRCILSCTGIGASRVHVLVTHLDPVNSPRGATSEIPGPVAPAHPGVHAPAWRGVRTRSRSGHKDRQGIGTFPSPESLFLN